MKELLTYIVQNLVEKPDEVSVTEREANGETVFEVRVADGDMGDGLHQDADLFDDPALTADDLAHIVRCDAQLQRKLVRALLLRDGDVIGMLNKAAGDVEQQVFHFLHPGSYSALTFFSSARTVSVG